MDIGMAIGWFSSTVVFVTQIIQLREQVKKGSKGVSKWMFVGNVIATSGFVVYSYLQNDTIFLTANSIILCGHITGMILTFWQKSHEKKD